MQRRGSVLVYIVLISITLILSAQTFFYSRQEVEQIKLVDPIEKVAVETLPPLDEDLNDIQRPSKTPQPETDLPQVEQNSQDSVEVSDSSGDENLDVTDEQASNETLIQPDTGEELSEGVEEENQDSQVITSQEKTFEAQAPEPLIVEARYASYATDALYADIIIEATNVERESMGLNTLSRNTLLNQAATAKVNDMFDQQYFEHVGPDGKDVVDWVSDAPYNFISVGENLALGNFASEQAMVDAWMDSPGHRANILKESYSEIGVAVGYGTYNGSSVWMGVQVFGIPQSACPAVDTSLLSSIDIAQEMVDSLETRLDILYEQITGKNSFETQEEYNMYLENIEEYNSLVKQHDSAVQALTFMVDTYNNQVSEFNSCVSTVN